MKRKLSALALAAALGLSLTACSGGTASSPAPAGSGAPEGTPAQSADSDWSYVEGNGKLKIGYTLFEPMNYIGEDGELTGFETEFATAVC